MVGKKKIVDTHRKYLAKQKIINDLVLLYVGLGIRLSYGIGYYTLLQ